ncbi:hypothetical protein FOPG_08063 [Fusarium oxysporum f. sp. conglutinans race 2 54008]|uniref:Uncharacterized protein n=1 Tax=Fusarium oxysporum f. sp. conglutinans race 2 54008 TaxID=1089457 RepID=X0IX06_FUSOX|nr:hypothetical protein FOPG_08063 [Fusarium oxysporum f. sp. conglutinans race 2 54008]EXL77509.1 hypothetical protein FOPG_08063 [Fusarium oxysporum f. sp. conglutinans race 2 54008]
MSYCSANTLLFCEVAEGNVLFHFAGDTVSCGESLPYLTLPLCLPVFVFLQHGDIQHWANYRFCLCCILPFEFKRNWFHCFELKPVSPPRVRSKCLDDRGSIRNCQPFVIDSSYYR